MNKIADKTLKARAHTLKPVVLIGQAGLTAAVLAEVESALARHELIKIKIRTERDLRRQISVRICADTGAALIQSIGHMTVLYRPNAQTAAPPKRAKPGLRAKYTRSK